MAAENIPLIVIFCSTGQQGRSIIRELTKLNKDTSNNKQFHIRGLTRNVKSKSALSLLKQYPDIELCNINLKDNTSIINALKNAYGVYLLTNPWGKDSSPAIEIEQTQKITDIIYDINNINNNNLSSIKHIILGSAICADEKLGVPHWDSKGIMEKYITDKNNNTLLEEKNKKILHFLRWGFYYENFSGAYDAFKPKNGILPAFCSINKKIPMASVYDFGIIVTELFSNPKPYLNWYNNYCDVISEYLSFEEIADRLNKLYKFNDKEKLVAVNQRAQLPLLALEPILKLTNEDFYDMIVMFDIYEKSWKSKKISVQALDIFKNNLNIKMKTADDFLQSKMNTSQLKEECRKKEENSVTVSNVVTLAVVGGLGYAAYRYYKSKYDN